MAINLETRKAELTKQIEFVATTLDFWKEKGLIANAESARILHFAVRLATEVAPLLASCDFISEDAWNRIARLIANGKEWKSVSRFEEICKKERQPSGKPIFVHEHVVPVAELKRWIRQYPANTKDILEQFGKRAIILYSDEDKLREKKVQSRMPHGYELDLAAPNVKARYDLANITIKPFAWKPSNEWTSVTARF